MLRSNRGGCGMNTWMDRVHLKCGDELRYCFVCNCITWWWESPTGWVCDHHEDHGDVLEV